jgi:hypothetical protein
VCLLFTQRYHNAVLLVPVPISAVLWCGVQALEKHEQAIRDRQDANAKATADSSLDSKNVPGTGNRVIEITPNKPPIVSADIGTDIGTDTGTDTGATRSHKDVDKEGK